MYFESTVYPKQNQIPLSKKCLFFSCMIILYLGSGLVQHWACVKNVFKQPVSYSVLLTHTHKTTLHASIPNQLEPDENLSLKPPLSLPFCLSFSPHIPLSHSPDSTPKPQASPTDTMENNPSQQPLSKILLQSFRRLAAARLETIDLEHYNILLHQYMEASAQHTLTNKCKHPH